MGQRARTSAANLQELFESRKEIHYRTGFDIGMSGKPIDWKDVSPAAFSGFLEGMFERLKNIR